MIYAKIIGFVAFCLLLIGSGFWVCNNSCEREKLENQNNALNEVLVVTKDFNEVAKKVDQVNRKSDRLLNKVSTEVINAKDSSFGCVPNADGMRITLDTIAISSDPSKFNE